jgi:cytochrome c biogenesis factor
VRKPDHTHGGELYLSPLEVVTGPRQQEATWLPKGREVVLDGVGYTFKAFRMVPGASPGSPLTVCADIQVRKDGSTLNVAPALRVGAQVRQPVAAQIDGLGPLSLEHIDADRGQVAVSVPRATSAAGMALVELSTKPLISLVWIGALLAIVGSGLAGLRRAAEKAPASGHATSPARRSPASLVP